MAKETMKEKIARLEAEVKDWEKSYKEISGINVRFQEELNEFKNGTVEMVPREEYERVLKLLNDKEVNLKAAQEIIEYEKKKREEVSKSNFKMILSEREKELEQELEECYKRIERLRGMNKALANDKIELKKKIAHLKAGTNSGEWGNKQLWEEVSRLNKRVKEMEIKEMDLRGEKEELEQSLKEEKAKCIRNKEPETSQRVKELEKKLSRKGVEGIGRKKDIYLEVYLESCIMKGMTAKEIIGSEYQGFDGMKTVKKSTYYKWLKEHKKK